MANYYVLLTDHGKSFVANAQANSQLALTHVVLGDANDQPYLPESRLNQTKLVHQTAKLPVASVKVINETTAEVSAVVPSNVGGFNVHEIGITDSSGKLIYIGNFHGGYRPTLTEGAGGDMELIFTITADNLATVVIEMNGNVVSATRDWVTEHFVTKPNFQEHLDAKDPHPGYVLGTTYNIHVEDYENHVSNYDEHVKQNEQQHKAFNDWQINHVAMLDKEGAVNDPHPQYVHLSEFNEMVVALNKRIDELLLEAGVGAVLGRLDMSFSGSTNSYSAFATINNVRYTVAENGDFNFILSERFNNGSIGEVTCRSGDSSLLVNLYYPEGFDPTKHEIRSSRNYVEREDGTGIYFALPYTSDREEDSNFYKYFISTSFYFEIVKK
ncbi:phage tail-collar fiber domain-containing protein [Psychrobacter alimentarius]|uniref:phage tail-collar fiber domain-containing protein n=1 Tax=Psychrobacter alimentarius TaxID=261164 RepID=UPI0019199A45|nr:phage tail protein [Psychrobacter alimentarius]